MPKMKSRRAVGKRFSLTARGKVKLKKSNLRHILTKQRADKKRQLRQGGLAAAADVPRIKRALAYR